MEIYFVSGNEGKRKEYKRILWDYGIKLKFRKFSLLEIQAESLEDVAKYKVKDAYERIEKPVFIEDAGLFINSLNGFPGVYSAYALKTIGNEGILDLLKKKKDRSAYFKAVIAYMDEHGKTHIFSGKVNGKISKKEKGKYGFGFDPIFIPDGFKKTFAEDIELKNELSHRKRAIDKFVKFLRNRYE